MTDLAVYAAVRVVMLDIVGVPELPRCGPLK